MRLSRARVRILLVFGAAAGWPASAVGIDWPTSAAGPATSSAPVCADGQCTLPDEAGRTDSPPEPLLLYRRPELGATPESSTGQADAGNPLRRPALAPPQLPAQASPVQVVAVDPAQSAATQPSAPPYGTPATASHVRYDASVTPSQYQDAADYMLPPTTGEEPANAAVELAPAAPPSEPALAALSAVNQAGADARLLAPQSSSGARAASRGVSESDRAFWGPAFSKLEAVSSAGAALAAVVGLFLVCAWLLRRGGPKSSGGLPPDAFAVLGRAPLTSQSFAQLLRVGNKLVLVAMTSDGAQPLTEVTDPAEVDRIAGLCMSGRAGGSSAEFQQVLAQLSREPARGFLGRENSSRRRGSNG